MTRTERLYYVIFGLYSASWSLLGPVYPIFLLSRGLNFLEINLVLATYLITAFIFEVPTGAVADLAGRKVSFLLSCALRFFAFGLYAFADDFLDCVIAEFIDAVGTTLATGALDAWAVDGTRADGDKRPADRLFARAQMLARILMITAGITGGYLGQWSFTSVWFAAAGGFGLTFVVGLIFMREPRAATAKTWANVGSSLGRGVRDGFAVVRQTPVALWLCLLTMTTAIGMMPINMLWPPRISELTGEGPWLLGWIWAFLNVTAFLGSAVIPRLLPYVGRLHLLWVSALWRGVMYGVVGLATTVYPAVAALLLQEISFGVSEPLLLAWMNEQTDSARRATVLSVRSMFFTFGGAAGLVALGLIAQYAGMRGAWIGAAMALIVTALGFIILARVARRANPAVLEDIAILPESGSKRGVAAENL